MTAGRPRVLIVEDDLSIRETLVRILGDEGYEVEALADGARALELLRRTHESPPDVILLDLMIPGMDGRHFRRALLADPALAAVPVLVLSASGVRPTEARDLQVAEVLRKPVRLERLLVSLARVLDSIAPGKASGIGAR
jgi:CheY-like chemotaxis protein